MSRLATIESYRELRNAGRVFHGKVLKVIPRPIIVSTATELGLWRKGILVTGEDGADVLADRMIYDKRWAGKSALEHFEEEVAESAWTDDERRFARAMRTAYVSLFEIVDARPGSHVVLVERVAGAGSGGMGSRIELVDLGLSETALPGAFLAVRLPGRLPARAGSRRLGRPARPRALARPPRRAQRASSRRARAYGVVIDPETLTVDAAALPPASRLRNRPVCNKV